MGRAVRQSLAAVLLASLLRAADAAAQGCAMCGTALGANGARTRAFQWSILFLMAVPYVLAGGFAGWLYLAARRRRAAARAAAGFATDYKESLS